MTTSVAEGTRHPTALIDPEARLGVGVHVGPYAVIRAGVEVGDQSTIGAFVSLGEPTAEAYAAAGRRYEQRPCRIGSGAMVRSHCVIYEGTTIGDDFQSGHHVTIREGTTIGASFRAGTMCDIQDGVRVGDHVRFHSSVFVARGTTIGDFVWLFPSVTLTNDPHPPSDTCTQGPTIGRFAAVGARATLLAGVSLGEHCVIGAGAVVTRDVPEAMLAVGVPARIVGPASETLCKHGRLERVYPWPLHFRRGYPEGALDVGDFTDVERADGV